MLPTISLLIPVYKNHVYAIDCVQSALVHVDQFIEIIIADDCPNEPLSKFWPEVTSLPDNVKYIVNSVNIGRAQTYNLLLSAAAGDFYIMLDGDDLLQPAVDFHKLRSILSVETNISILSGRCFEFDEIGIIRWSGRSTTLGKSTGVDYYRKWTSPAETLPHSASIIRLSAAKGIGGYPLSYISSDITLLKKLLIMGDIYIVEDTLSSWRYHGANASKSIDIKELVNNINHIIDSSLFAKNNANFPNIFSLIHDVRSLNAYITGCGHQFLANESLLNLIVLYKSIINRYISNSAVVIASTISIFKIFLLITLRCLIGKNKFRKIMKKRGNYLYSDVIEL